MVPVPEYVERIVKVPQERVVQVTKEVDKVREVIKEVPEPYSVERVVEKYVKVPKEEIVEKKVPYYVEKIVEVIKEVEHIKEVEVPVEKVCVLAVCRSLRCWPGLHLNGDLGLVWTGTSTPQPSPPQPSNMMAEA